MSEPPDWPREFEVSRRTTILVILAIIAAAVLVYLFDPGDQEDEP
jgi:preprotein translocase subunit SecE